MRTDSAQSTSRAVLAVDQGRHGCCGGPEARTSIQVAIVANSVQLSVNDNVVRVHPIRHDRTKEHGAFATPNGRPRKPKTA